PSYTVTYTLPYTTLFRSGDIIALRDFVLIIAQEGDVDFLFLRPSFLRKRIVAADAVDFAVEVGVFTQAIAHAAHLSRAGASERQDRKSTRLNSSHQIISY